VILAKLLARAMRVAESGFLDMHVAAGLATEAHNFEVEAAKTLEHVTAYETSRDRWEQDGTALVYQNWLDEHRCLVAARAGLRKAAEGASFALERLEALVTKAEYQALAKAAREEARA
jgi:hypothetical protein